MAIGPEEEKQVLQGWLSHIDGQIAAMHPTLQKSRRDFGQRKTTVWLGGPGADHELYPVREMIARTLGEHGFEVFVSVYKEKGKHSGPNEIDRVRTFDMALVLALSTGSSAEAVALAQFPDLYNRLFIYIPQDFETGYVYKSLDCRRLIRNDSSFLLAGLQTYDPELCRRIWERATTFRAGWRPNVTLREKQADRFAAHMSDIKNRFERIKAVQPRKRAKELLDRFRSPFGK